jgi:hypothetical protein
MPQPNKEVTTMGRVCSNHGEEATFFTGKYRHVPEEFIEELKNPLFAFLREKYSLGWEPEDLETTTPLFLEVLDSWFDTLEEAIEEFVGIVNTHLVMKDSYPDIRPPMRSLAYLFDGHKHDMIAILEFIRATCQTDPTVVGCVRNPEKALSNLPDGHLMKKLYALRAPDETCSDWQKRTGITSKDIYDAMEDGLTWGLDSRRLALALRAYGAKCDDSCFNSPPSKVAPEQSHETH